MTISRFTNDAICSKKAQEEQVKSFMPETMMMMMMMRFCGSRSGPQ